jgi:VIT1/CCC1 family predicted Fe2+/Mn2+ transporter
MCNIDGLICAASLCAVALMLVGAIKTVATRTSAFKAAMENLLIGGVAAGISYAVGAIYTAVVGDGHSLHS